MYLVYIDESGNTGNDLSDSQQPVFLLASLVVSESCWQALEADLVLSFRTCFPDLADIDIEVHAADLRSGRNAFKGRPVASRIDLAERWLDIAHKHNLKVVYRAIEKKRFHQWLVRTFGTGIIINPHVVAFLLVARVVDEHLSSLGNDALGMFISDENKEIVRDVEKSIKVLRSITGALRLNRIVEKGFFIDSAKSRVLQLCDLCALTARKHEERELGLEQKTIDTTTIQRLKPLIHRGNEAFEDVMTWLRTSQSTTSK